MELENLPDETRAAVQSLLRGVEEALNGDDSPHTRAVSYSWIEDAEDPDAALTGAGITAPSKPPFDYDEDAISALHRAALESSGRFLYAIVIHIARATTDHPWRATVKVVARQEHAAIRAERAQLDDLVRRELEPLARGAEYASFGRVNRGKPVRLVRFDESGLKDLSPTESLLAALKRAEDLYRRSGLDLVIANWSLRGSDLDFREYFE